MLQLNRAYYRVIYKTLRRVKTTILSLEDIDDQLHVEYEVTATYDQLDFSGTAKQFEVGSNVCILSGVASGLRFAQVGGGVWNLDILLIKCINFDIKRFQDIRPLNLKTRRSYQTNIRFLVQFCGLF